MTQLLMVVLLVAAPSVQATLSPEDLEATAKKLEGLLMSPCCMSNTVAVHESGTSDAMRREIRQMLGAGKTRGEILDFYVAKHGEQILALPAARGFNLAAYVLPMAFLFLGAVALTLIVRRWRSASGPSTDPAPRPVIPGRYAERLREQLRELD